MMFIAIIAYAILSLGITAILCIILRQFNIIEDNKEAQETLKKELGIQ